MKNSPNLGMTGVYGGKDLLVEDWLLFPEPGRKKGDEGGKFGPAKRNLLLAKRVNTWKLLLAGFPLGRENTYCSNTVVPSKSLGFTPNWGQIGRLDRVKKTRFFFNPFPLNTQIIPFVMSDSGISKRHWKPIPGGLLAESFTHWVNSGSLDNGRRGSRNTSDMPLIGSSKLF